MEEAMIMLREALWGYLLFDHRLEHVEQLRLSPKLCHEQNKDRAQCVPSKSAIELD